MTLNHKNQIAKAYNSSMNLLTARTRSIKEIQDHLYRKKFNDDIISETVLILKEQGFIDDKKFAEEFISTREKIRPKSKFALKYELYKKGVSDSIIENAICNIDEYKSALAAIDPKLSTWLKLDMKQIKTKMMNFLKNRGFNWEVSCATYETFLKNLKTRNQIDEN